MTFIICTNIISLVYLSNSVLEVLECGVALDIKLSAQLLVLSHVHLKTGLIL